MNRRYGRAGLPAWRANSLMDLCHSDGGTCIANAGRRKWKQRDLYMYGLIQDPGARGGGLPPPQMPRRTRTGIYRSAEPGSGSGPMADHDATLLLAALEEVEARRLAIEWLLEADLLRLCMA
jgi:hypothetical protein